MTVVGFDFGTTNSLVSVVHDDRVHDLLDDDDMPTPSVVRYQGNRTIVGREAREALDAPGLGIHGDFVRSPKNYLGLESITVGGVDLSPIDVAYDVIDHVKHRALEDNPAHARFLGDITEAVATIPVNMDGHGRRALRDAYARAGIRVVQFVHEPFAALYGHARPLYGTDFIQRYNRKNVLVVDWGGGTLDLTLCLVQDGRVLQRQSSGTHELGGDVFDETFRNHVLLEEGVQAGDLDPERRRQLRNRCELQKIKLSTANTATVYIPNFHGPGKPLSYQMTREEFESITKPLMDQAIRDIGNLLIAAGLNESQIALCLVTGGMSRMPAIAARLREYLSAHRVQVSSNSATLIAQGAAWIAHDRKQLQLAKDIEVQLARGGYHRVVKAGTEIPFEGQELPGEPQEFFCADPRDGVAKFELCATARPGGRPQLSDQRYPLGNLNLDVDSKARPFIERLTLTAALDCDGILHVKASSDHFHRHEHESIHNLEFAISLGPAEQTCDAEGDNGPPANSVEEPAIGQVVVRSNIAAPDEKYRTLDYSLIPGDLLYSTNRMFFMRGVANRATKLQEEELLYYRPCAVCGRVSNHPDCHCGSAPSSR
ncbi:Hsp70 family protein [Nocardia tengchongensis]|uniref:Hsp70 family protein n=1 Tax=Nocardia tengchongensis TaxID=2055889 RepID=UPI0036B7AF0B